MRRGQLSALSLASQDEDYAGEEEEEATSEKDSASRGVEPSCCDYCAAMWRLMAIKRRRRRCWLIGERVGSFQSCWLLAKASESLEADGRPAKWFHSDRLRLSFASK